MLRIETAKSDVVGSIHDHGEDVLLADPHRRPEMITLLADQFGLQHLGREVLRVSRDIPHQSLKIRSCGSGSKRSPTPIVQQRSGQRRTRERRDWFDDQLSLSQPLFGLRSQGRRNESFSRLMLLSQPRLDRTDVVVERGNSSRRGFCFRAAVKGKQPKDEEQDPKPLVPGRTNGLPKVSHAVSIIAGP